MSAEWWSGLAPAELTIDCGGQEHRLRWAEGELHARDHADIAGERTLAALGGEPSACVGLYDAWMRHTDDLDVLVSASRGPADPLGGGDEGQGRGGMWLRPRGAGMAARRGTGATISRASARPAVAPRPRGRGNFGWFAYAPLNSPGATTLDPENELDVLLTLGSGLPDRLVATVLAAWAERLADGDERAAAARAALHAALYGRALLALRSWLADPELDIELTVCAPGEPRSLTRDGDGPHLTVPFAWLCEVWARGFATVVGRFVLAAAPATAGGSWRLSAVGPDLGGPGAITLTLGG